MTIRTCINAGALSAQLSNLEACAQDAPEGAYEDAKALNAFFAATFVHLRGELVALGLALDNSDGYREFEAVLYGLIKDSNPDCTTFAVSEGFGSAMDGPARDRVIAQAAGNIATLRALGVVPHPAA
ncbi:hypothetical protein MARCHEWKA_04010 [Brevundimonas phage vB_BpoS-Marchewka]|uniref:Uncharacterized protein n=1 Tax=Brevundimonas phage vB_BpoS-Marchewka TaxID=2948604 RepID=A0A9E7N349_9CAUD|nr:hypothetical protein MARCHEWKA_04010 [Brevundimonas phage vB_BpoS-Marchewka]